jgi:hypothetical protein
MDPKRLALSTRPLITILAVSPLLLVACGGATTMRAEWRDADYQGGRIDHVMTIGVFQQPIYRRLLEDELVAQLRQRQVTAVSSASVMPDGQQPTREAIEAEVMNRGFHAVLVTRLLDVEKSKQIVEATSVQIPHAYYNSLYSYYYTVTEEMQQPGYTKEKRVVVIESNLYDTATGELIWTAISETFDVRSGQDAVKEVGSLIVKSLENHGLL